jgi:hypothetical protein
VGYCGDKWHIGVQTLCQYLHVLQFLDHLLDQLIANLRQNRGNLEIKAIDF